MVSSLTHKSILCLVLLLLTLACSLVNRSNPDISSQPAPTRSLSGAPLPDLEQVRTWLYLIDNRLEEDTVQQIAASSYDLVVLDFTSSETGSQDDDLPRIIDQLHAGAHPKRVIAYLDIGQAEDYRDYWQPGWKVGSPEWIAGVDPDGWSGNYPVAYWNEDWRQIWLGRGGMLDRVLAAGFDGVYLDWIEAYDDENVVALAQQDGRDAVKEMVRWVSDISAHIRAACTYCAVIAQNAAGLAQDPTYRAAIDAIAQEQIWFDGGTDNRPPGDCPLPRTAEEIDTPDYRRSLSAACRKIFDQDPQSPLHTSSAEYLQALSQAQSLGLVIFSVDYAEQADNVTWVYSHARALGFIPFVGRRSLDNYLDPVP